jgi:hypothetical protein
MQQKSRTQTRTKKMQLLNSISLFHRVLHQNLLIELQRSKLFKGQGQILKWSQFSKVMLYGGFSLHNED